MKNSILILCIFLISKICFAQDIVGKKYVALIGSSCNDENGKTFYNELYFTSDNVIVSNYCINDGSKEILIEKKYKYKIKNYFIYIQNPTKDKVYISNNTLIQKNINYKLVEEVIDNEIYSYESVDVKPKYPDGLQNFLNYVTTKLNLRYYNYNLTDKDLDIEVSFVIEKDGYIRNVTILNDLGDNRLKLNASIVFGSSKMWRSGEINGNIVRTSYQVKIKITADSE